jgi:hypothetical protein
MFQSTLNIKRAALAGTLAAGMAIAISSFTVVRAEHATPNRAKKTVFNCSAGTACLTGSSTGSSTTGVEGTSVSANGVLGTTNSTDGNSGIAGISSGTSGHANGTYGRSSNGPGVYGSSSASNGIEGHSTADGSSGIAGYQLNTSSNAGNGVSAESADTSGLYEALEARADSSQTFIFWGYNAANHTYCQIDPNGNLACSGTIEAITVRTRHVNSSGQHVLAYGAETTSATLEDFGSARMIGGVANVAVDRAFGSTIRHDGSYMVFLTPSGDNRGLYVTAKTPTGFEVREAQAGRSTLAFDYRIVARPLDAKNDPLPLARPARFPRARAIH